MNAPKARYKSPLGLWLGAGTLVLATLGFLAATMPSDLRQGPAYGGRSLSAWLRVLHNPKSSTADQFAAQVAIRFMGTNVVPVLLVSMDEPGESTLARLVRVAGGFGIRCRLPMHLAWSRAGLLRLSVGVFDEPTRQEAARALFAAYVTCRRTDHRAESRAQNLASTLFNLGDCSYWLLAASLTNAEPRVRASAASLVGFTTRTPTNFISALVERVSDPDATVRSQAVNSLGRFRKNAADVVPVATTALRDRDSGVRFAAMDALARYGGAAKSALPELMDLAARDPQLRTTCFDCVRRINPEGADRLIAGLLANRTPSLDPSQAGTAGSRGTNPHE